MRPSHSWKIKVAKNHSKLGVNTGRQCTVLLHVGSKNKIGELSERKELDKEHDAEGSKIR